MTALLSYTPSSDEQTETTLETGGFAKAMDNSIWFSCTPDLPLMRYAKTIPVFIWDETKSYKNFATDIGLTHDMFETEKHMIHTTEKFLPFGNVAKKKASMHDLLCPSSATWTDLFTDNPLGADATPRLISGRILHVSLVGLQVLDRYYYNTALHTRRKTQFKPTYGGPEETAWMYTMPAISFTKYLPHEGTYEMLRGFDPVMCSSINLTTYTSTHTAPAKAAP